MNKSSFSWDEWRAVAVGFGLGFVLCLIGVGFWPPTGDKFERDAKPNPDGNGEYQEVSKSAREWLSAAAERTLDDPIALYTLVLAAFTIILGYATVRLWFATKQIADISERSAEALVNMDRAYLTGGGDIQRIGGVRCFRVEVANYGKTAAYLSGYDVRFATQEQAEAGPRPIFRRYTFDDRIPPGGGIKRLAFHPVEEGAEVIYGGFWYRDLHRKSHTFRFILRIHPNGHTRTDVSRVSDRYRKWT